MNSESLIHLDNIKKVFLIDEVETHALAGVHFGIARGEYVSISGPSGCGKSTLLAILGLLDTPSEGGYRLNGREVASIDAGERARIRNQEIGFVFQAPTLTPWADARTNVWLPLRLQGVSKAFSADEPTGNLDSKNGEAVMALLDELHQGGATICMVTHDPRYADFAQRKIFMFDGRVVDEETMHRLRHEEDQRLIRPRERSIP